MIFKLPLYILFRKFGKPIMMPFNYTLSITYRCNSRCKTCNIWQKKVPVEMELNTEEWIKILKSLGRSPFWITISGGEPFLRKDLTDIIEAIMKYNKPSIINIPTNGILKIDKKIREILDILNGTKLVINFSIDGICEEHDEIRGVKGNWKRIIENYWNVKNINNENLIVGIHTVISKWNVKRFQEIAKYILENLKPDQYITEIAEERKEMENFENSPTPDPLDYEKAINFLIRRIEIGLKKREWKGLAAITEAFRLEYYRYVRDLYLGRVNGMKSYAGFASCQISPIGDVWECAVYATKMGNLRDYDYDFKKLWKSKKAWEVRKKIKEKHVCPLANEAYTNMLFNPVILLKVVKRLIFP